MFYCALVGLASPIVIESTCFDLTIWILDHSANVSYGACHDVSNHCSYLETGVGLGPCFQCSLC